MTSKSQRRANKRRAAAISLPGEPRAEHVARQPDGRVKPEDARKTVIEARIRQCGIKDTPDARRDMADPMLGCAIGRALSGKANRAALWEAVCHARRTVAAYDHACGAPRRHPQVLRILAPRDVMHADAASPALDMRTPEERDRQAVAAWARMHGWLMHCDGAARTAFHRAVIDEIDAPIRDLPGVLNVLACIAEGMAGETVRVRVRLT